jgi:hypothetical protein
MQPGGDDLEDDLVIDEFASEGEDHLVPGISHDSEDDRAASSGSASLLAKKRKRKAMDKEKKAKVRLCGEYILNTDHS